jgi:hypothetical protein
MRYCPICDSEYADGATHCRECGVDLVSSTERLAPLHESDRNERVEILWRSGDPTAVSAVIAILRQGGIRHHVQPTNDHMVFEIGIPRPKFVVRVFSSDMPRAKEFLADIHEISPFGFLDDDTADDFGPAASSLPISTPTPWNPAEATIELWKGSEIARADYLEACLAENQIGVRRVESQKQAGMFSLFVMPPDEPLALEILREITDSTPRT